MATGKYNLGKLPYDQPYRLVDEIDPSKKHYWHNMTMRNLSIMDEVVKIANKIGRTPSQVSLRWLMQQKVVTIPIFSARTVEQVKENLGCLDFTLTDEQMEALDKASRPALTSIMPEVGPYPYPMLEYGSPALPEFYSRFLLFGNMENKIINHRRLFPYRYNR